jgi:hypothetical protein
MYSRLGSGDVAYQDDLADRPRDGRAAPGPVIARREPETAPGSSGALNHPPGRCAAANSSTLIQDNASIDASKLVLCCASVRAMGEDLAARFRDPIISRSGRNHARIDVVKLLAVQDVGRADVRVLERRERHIVSGAPCASSEQACLGPFR